ncbi:hypothetical protein fugu_001193 [Takifugu bimaculatus]|uniref:Solute carrier family 2, facilitated glucose transporter member 5 n=1 Tax=Takifugu bimaculatus TaxID=433685 RepID=A0A4Z2CJ86_9TELE|nr:hypothetical protein fugu_001193 [Takifugu bimaculatus]
MFVKMCSGSAAEAADTKKPMSRTLALAVCSAAIGGTFQYGYNISIINSPTTYIEDFINSSCVERWGTALETTQLTFVWTFIVSAFSLGGFFGALLGGPMAVRLGRKSSLLLNNSFLVIGAVLALTCRLAKSFEVLILARFLVGINSGVSMNVQHMYVVESAPKHHRGAVVFISAVFTAFGIFLGQIVGLSVLLGTEPHWHYLLASNALPGLIQLVTLPWFPESPRYLLIDRSDKEACMNALRSLNNGEVPVSEMDEMLQEQEQLKCAALNSGPETSALTMWSLFWNCDLRPQLIVIVVAGSTVMLCGIDAIYFYSLYIFSQAGIPSEKIEFVTIGTGACELLASLFSILLVDRLGRRALLIGGYSLMTIFLIVLTVALTLETKHVPGMPYVSMVCVFAFIIFFGLGPAGVTCLLPAEIFDQVARPAAGMICGSLYWICLFLVGMVFPFMIHTLDSFCFLPFMVVCLLTAIFFCLFLPETKGKTLAEITAVFGKKAEKGLKK